MSRYTPYDLNRISPTNIELYEDLVYMVIDYRKFSSGNNLTNKSQMIRYYKFTNNKTIITNPTRMIDVTHIYAEQINPDLLLTNFWDQIEIITRNTNNDTC